MTVLESIKKWVERKPQVGDLVHLASCNRNVYRLHYVPKSKSEDWIVVNPDTGAMVFFKDKSMMSKI